LFADAQVHQLVGLRFLVVADVEVERIDGVEVQASKPAATSGVRGAQVQRVRRRMGIFPADQPAFDIRFAIEVVGIDF